MAKIKNLIQASIAVKTRMLESDALLMSISESVRMIVSAYQEGKRLYLCGNGGSASDAQHIAAELTGRFYKDRQALPAEALHANTSYLTAVANDYDYDVVYSRMVEGTMRNGDILIGLSTSGNSKNIVKAFESARKLGVHTIGLTGASGGKMKDLSDVLITIPATDTPRIQECHILVGHIICQLVEEALFE